MRTTAPNKPTLNASSVSKRESKTRISHGVSLRHYPPGTDPSLSKKAIFPIHKILAERPSKSDPRKTEYRVQWEPSWESASTVRGSAKLKEWEKYKTKGSVFRYWGGDGRTWMVLKDEVKWSDDSEERQWEMWCWVRRMVAQDQVPKSCFAVRRDWFAKFAEGDWEFADGEAEFLRGLIVRANGGLFEDARAIPVTALDVLKWSYQRLENARDPGKEALPFGMLRIRFMGTLDTRLKAQELASAYEKRQRRGFLTVEDLIRPIFANPFSTLEEKAFTNADQNNTATNAERWRNKLEKLIRKAPYMLHGGSWILLFALLLLRGDELRKILKSMGIATRRDWNNHAREYALWMYYEQIDDNREPHAIMETFLNLTSFFRELNEEGEQGGQEEDEEDEEEDEEEDTEEDSEDEDDEGPEDDEDEGQSDKEMPDPDNDLNLDLPVPATTSRPKAFGQPKPRRFPANNETQSNLGARGTKGEQEDDRTARFVSINRLQHTSTSNTISRRFSVTDDAEDEEYEPPQEVSEDDVLPSFVIRETRNRRKGQRMDTDEATEDSRKEDHPVCNIHSRRKAISQPLTNHSTPAPCTNARHSSGRQPTAEKRPPAIPKTNRPTPVKPPNRNRIPRDRRTVGRFPAALRRPPRPASPAWTQYFMDAMDQIMEAERDPRESKRQRLNEADGGDMESEEDVEEHAEEKIGEDT
ncbi:hypothetical protein P154DRAFT_602588 [Amniculicola lignicola CBS 123094]|uniref:Uncharacterized protein n=1 Tax=Amniculicola lignicola CBS 123094 TaxID=1392246 RepID=A0A6A5WM84_9PLEO|nr:hypothetical protein P154DRAFT_602588 [Amniculicola lignicola CBS 123094]